METQRVEALRRRRIEETEMRGLQQRTAKNQRVWVEKKIISRVISKQFLAKFKKGTTQTLVDQGILRKRQEYSMDVDFLPLLYKQVQFDLTNKNENVENIESLLGYVMRGMAKNHRESVIKEYKRREEKKKEKIRLQREREEEKKRRKEERLARREKFRIAQLFEKIQAQIINTQEIQEFTPQVKIYDVRDADGKKDGIFLIGGFVGELIITFTCLQDYILANPQNQNFQFTLDSIKSYLKDLLINENFSDGIINLHITRDPTLKESDNKEEDKEPERIELDNDTYMRFCLTKQNISDFGLGFFFEICKDLVISTDFIESLYKVIVDIANTKKADILEPPQMPGPDEEGKEPTEE